MHVEHQSKHLSCLHLSCCRNGGCVAFKHEIIRKVTVVMVGNQTVLGGRLMGKQSLGTPFQHEEC